jgi:hypothetical protein
LILTEKAVSVAVRKAREMYVRHPGIEIPVDAEKLALSEGCELVEWPFIYPVKEAKQGRWIGIAQGLESREKRHLIAHALAHHLLHCGNQLSFHGMQRAEVQRQEQEADECAAHILMPGRELAKCRTNSIFDIADRFDVPEEFALLRVTRYATEQEKYRWKLCDCL